MNLEESLIKKVTGISEEDNINKIEIKLYSALLKRKSNDNIKEKEAIAKDLYNQLLDKKEKSK